MVAKKVTSKKVVKKQVKKVAKKTAKKVVKAVKKTVKKVTKKVAKKPAKTVAVKAVTDKYGTVTVKSVDDPGVATEAPPATVKPHLDENGVLTMVPDSD